MKKLLILSAAFLSLAGSAVASPLCANAKLDFYQTTYVGFSNACQIGDKLFYDFTYTQVDAPTADQASVIPDPGDGVSNPGLIFSVGGFLVFPGESMTATITYSVVTLSGSALIEDYSLTIAGSHKAGGIGSGSVTESFTNAPAGTPLVTGVGPGSFAQTSAHVDFTPLVSGTTVTTVIQLQSPDSGTDRVTISAIQEHFSEQIPEPYESVLVGSGLLIFGLGLRRKKVSSEGKQ